MNTHKINNPFITVGYKGSKYFCNRVEETNRLIENMRAGNSTSIISVRRIGKTGLIKHLLAQLPSEWKGIYIDILDTENLNQLLNTITSAIIQSIPEKSNLGKKLWTLIKAMRPVITYDTLSGTPQATFELKQQEVEKNIHEVFTFLDNQNLNILIAIDEFQQILNYPEKNTDAWLRSKMQQLNNVFFIFSGSQQHLMKDLFGSPNRPFFRSTHLLKLEKLNKEVYQNFIIKMFKLYKKELNKEIANKILDWADVHTFYVQQLCNRIFSATTNAVTDEIWKDQAYILLKEQETIFYSYRNMLTPSQWNLLKAIAKEEKVFHPSAKDFIKTYNLGTSAGVLRSLQSLLNVELIYIEFNDKGEQYYSVYDIFFRRWIETVY